MVSVEPLAKKNNNRLEVDCPADLGQGVGDPTRIRQCVLNLVGQRVQVHDERGGEGGRPARDRTRPATG